MLRSALPLARARIVGFADEELSSFEFQDSPRLRKA
jgi:hypothetical protein